MKCLKAIKTSKHLEIGEVKKVSNDEAIGMVSTGYWDYTPKSEYKKLNLDIVPVNQTSEIIKKRGKKH